MKALLLIAVSLVLCSCVKVSKSTSTYKYEGKFGTDKLQIGSPITGYKCEILSQGETKNLFLMVETDAGHNKMVSLFNFLDAAEEKISPAMVKIEGFTFLKMRVSDTPANGLKGSGFLLHSGPSLLSAGETLIAIRGTIDLDEAMNGTLSYKIQSMRDNVIKTSEPIELARLENCRLEKSSKI